MQRAPGGQASWRNGAVPEGVAEVRRPRRLVVHAAQFGLREAGEDPAQKRRAASRAHCRPLRRHTSHGNGHGAGLTTGAEAPVRVPPSRAGAAAPARRSPRSGRTPGRPSPPAPSVWRIPSTPWPPSHPASYPTCVDVRPCGSGRASGIPRTWPVGVIRVAAVPPRQLARTWSDGLLRRPRGPGGESRARGGAVQPSFGCACWTTSKDQRVDPAAAGSGRSPPPWWADFIGPSIHAWNDSSSRHRV